MNAVANFSEYAVARNKAIAEPERARQLVRKALFGTDVQSERIRAAAERAYRSVSAGFAVDRCVDRAVEWALRDNEPSPPAAA